MSELDVIPIPGQPGKFARRAFVDAWIAAGSPPINSAGRLYALQKYFWDGWVERLPGFNPADNPDDETQRLAHVRFVAGDIDPTPDRVRRLEAAGLIRPYDYEPWHWELPNVRRYAIVRSIPNAGGNSAAPTKSKEDEMKETYSWWKDSKGEQQNLIYAVGGAGLQEFWTSADGAYNTRVAAAHNLAGPPAEVSEAHGLSLLQSLSNTRTGRA